MSRAKNSKIRRSDGLVAMSDVWVLKLANEMREAWRTLDAKASEYKDPELATLAERLLVISNAII